MKMYFGSENISELIQNSMDKIKTIIDTSTIVGEKITTEDGTTIIPISKVAVGYVVGGGEYSDNSRNRANRYPMTGGSSGGISVTPVGFLIETQGEVKYISVENKTAYQTILNMFNTVMRKINKDMEEAEEKEEKDDD